MTKEQNGQSGEGAKTGGFKLTRELGLALTGLLFVGAVGGWYLWNTNQSATVTPAAITPAASAQPAGAQPNPNAAARTPDKTAASGAATAPAAQGSAAGTTAGSVTRAPNPVEVPQIPFLTPAQKAAAAAKQPGAKPAAPAQVNTAGLPTQNPFRPFRVAAAANTGAPGNGQPNPTSNAGAFPAPRIATSGGLTNGNNTVTFTAPTILPAGRPAPSAPPVAIRSGGVLPPPALPVGGNIAPATPLPSGTAVTITPPPSARTPLPTLKAPKLNAGTAPSVPVGGPVTAGASATATPGSSVTATLPGANAGVPPVLSELDPTLTTAATGTAGAAGAGAAGSPNAAPGNALEQYVADQQISYDAVVLGPTNTGIFKTKNGFVVAAIGQKLEGSDVLVKNVTASSVTLALDNYETTLDLDQR